MDHPRRDVAGLPFPQQQLASVAVVLDRQLQLAPDNKQRLFLHFVVLQAEGVALVNVQDLADVASRLGEDELIAPWLGDALDVSRLEVAHGDLLTSPSGKRMATLSMMNSSIS